MLKAPFPWFGGKSKVAHIVWRGFGDVPNYVEPFFGSGAVLLGRPGGPGPVETVNDADGFICNFWRAVSRDPDEVARWAIWPVNENDLHARHYWLKQRRADLTSRLEGDPDYYDAKIAGWWVWGICCWIGSGFAGKSSDGPWAVRDGMLVKEPRSNGNGVYRQRPHLADGGQGIHRAALDVEEAAGVTRKLPHLGGGRGVTRSTLEHPSGRAKWTPEGIYAWMNALCARMQRVRVCCGDWTRILGPTPTTKNGLTGMFLDPPYAAERYDQVYPVDSMEVGHAVADWCVANGSNPLLRIALCSYVDTSSDVLAEHGWRRYRWIGRGGYAIRKGTSHAGNRYRECIWFSPHCLPIEDETECQAQSALLTAS